MIVDLRSDTVTRPTAGMRRAMAEAEVGDDVYGEDPTVQRLEAKVAELLGQEAAMLVPSGTMANQIAIRLHCRPGDEVILEAGGHSYLYESGALAAISLAQARPLLGERGILSPEAVRLAVHPPADHYPRSRLLVLENTSNTGGGTIYGPEATRALVEVARAAGLAVHLDGARIWNAHVATGRPLPELTRGVDTVSACLSKGLGAPVGSVLAGSLAHMREARRLRKMSGGGMRQAGVLAAAGLYALEHHLARLAQDHARLTWLLGQLQGLPGIHADPALHPTNIGFVTTRGVPGEAPAARLAERLAQRGVLAHAVSPERLRLVTHLDLTEAHLTRAAAVFAELSG